MSQPSGSFPADYRLTHKAEFDRVFTRPNQRCSQGVLQAIYKAAEGPANGGRIAPDGGARLGLIVAKRFIPLAVQRNRIKRLIREAFRTHRNQLPPIDIIVRVVRKPGTEVSAGEVIELFGKMHHSQR